TLPAIKQYVPGTLRRAYWRMLVAVRQSNGAARFDRRSVAAHYISGSGIEIGALHNPLEVSRSAKVRYVDRMSAEALREHYPELKDKALVHVDIIDDGETLGTVGDATQDFVIANHFLEHCQNPLLTLRNIFRKLRPD